MSLGTRSLPFEVPSYSLTGDVLSFQRCGLQYRYYNGSSLPPSRPVQMWTGEFVHGVLEEAYRYWTENRPAFPWPHTPAQWPLQPDAVALDSNDIGVIGHRVEVRLAAKGLRSRSEEARAAAYRRVEAAINLLCPHLFPLISTAEERISGTRDMPQLRPDERARGPRYELTGVVDVISSVTLGVAGANPLVRIIEAALPVVPAGEYDFIVDYKAGRRPPSGSSLRSQFEWQVQTYAWLKSQIPQARPVGAGLLIYINELSPSKTDFVEFRQEIIAGRTDIAPPHGSADYYAIHGWQEGQDVPGLTIDFRLRRALHIVDAALPLVQHAVEQIDAVVTRIESSAFREHNSGDILRNWEACGDTQDCDACDFRHFCPNPAHIRARAGGTNLQRRDPPVAPG